MLAYIVTRSSMPTAIYQIHLNINGYTV